ncbi:hypothetical protein AIIKEEIJ_04358 [Rhodococcus sp. YH1]|nr:hypothetical protein [Rhodococcus sp. YH1]
MVEHAGLEIAADLPFGAARAQPAGGDEVGQRPVRGGARRLQQPDLVFVLDHAQLLDQPGRGREGERAAQPRPAHVLFDGGDVALEAPPGRRGRGTDQVIGAGAGDPGPQVGHLRGDLGEVAAVGAHDGAGLVGVVVGGDEQRGVRTGEAGEVADVEQVRHQERIEVPVGEQPAQRGAAGGVIGGHGLNVLPRRPPERPPPGR